MFTDSWVNQGILLAVKMRNDMAKVEKIQAVNLTDLLALVIMFR